MDGCGEEAPNNSAFLESAMPKLGVGAQKSVDDFSRKEQKGGHTEPLIRRQEAWATLLPVGSPGFNRGHQKSGRSWHLHRPPRHYCKYAVMTAYNALEIVPVLLLHRHRGTWDSFLCVVELAASQTSEMWGHTLLLPNTCHGRSENQQALFQSSSLLSPYSTASLSPGSEATGVRCRKTTPR